MRDEGINKVLYSTYQFQLFEPVYIKFCVFI